MTAIREDRDPIRIFLAALPRLASALQSQLEVCDTRHDVAWTICDFAGRALELQDCVVYLIEDDGRSLIQSAAWGPKRIAERMFEHRIRLPVGAGIVGNCALIGAPQLVPDTRLDPRWIPDEGGGLSELAVPMLHAGSVLGVIDTEHSSADYYRSTHIKALQAVADCGAAHIAALRAV